jgi:hypothetical protein
MRRLHARFDVSRFAEHGSSIAWVGSVFAIDSATRRKHMARYGKAAAKSVKSAMHREKRGTLRSGKGGKGGRVTSRKQAIAIGLSEARKKGAKVPTKKS